MHLILTHEQVDFDALGALVAARLLISSSLAVLPHKLNQNVRKFVNLYQSELGLIDQGDIPMDPIQSVTLVDTQSLVTIKNLRKDAEIFIIDHHKQKADLPENWKCTFENLGATTTILVQLLKAQSIAITPLHATLILLAIHEDPGSLT